MRRQRPDVFAFPNNLPSMTNSSDEAGNVSQQEFAINASGLRTEVSAWLQKNHPDLLND